MHTSLRRALLSTALLVAGCSSASTAPTATSPDTFGGSATALSVDVLMPGVVFVPNRIDIAQGGVVRFVFASVAHDVRFGGVASAPADIDVKSNTTELRTFSAKGSFAFFCTLHVNMTGTVTVH